MGKLLALFFLLTSIAAAQGVRFSSTVTQQGTVGASTNVVVLPAAPVVVFCNHPANAVPCSNKATTYTDQTLATPCAGATQIVRDGTNTCVASPDAQNNWGVWVAPNTAGYDYTITLAGGVNLGPFNVLSQTTTMTGAVTFTGTLLCKNIENMLCIDPANTGAWGGAGNCTTNITVCLAAAIAALPTVSLNSVTYPTGIIWIAPGSYQQTTQFSMGSSSSVGLNFVKIRGSGKYATTINCTFNGACNLWDNSGGSGGDPGDGGFYDMTIIGNSGSSQVAFQGKDANGLNIRDVKLLNWAGASGGAIALANVNSQTERTRFDRLWIVNATCGITASSTTASNSYQHGAWIDLQFNLRANGQSAFCFGGNINFNDAFITSIVNNDATAGNTTTIFTLTGSGSPTLVTSWKGEVQLDNNGGGTVVGVNCVSGSPVFSPSGNFQGGSLTTPQTGVCGSYTNTLTGVQGADWTIYPGGPGSGNNPYTWRFVNPGTSQTLRTNAPSCAANLCNYVFDTDSITLTNKTLTAPTFQGTGANTNAFVVQHQAGGNPYVFQATNPGTSRTFTLNDASLVFPVAPLPLSAGGFDIGSTALPWGNLWLGTAATNNFKFAPAATAAARTVAMPDPLANVSLGFSYNATNPVYQTKRGVAGCTTAASIGGICATDITVTWGTAFPDANYSVTCTGNTPTAVPAAPFVVSGTKLAATVHINYFAITAVAASYATIDCSATHD